MKKFFYNFFIFCFFILFSFLFASLFTPKRIVIENPNLQIPQEISIPERPSQYYLKTFEDVKKEFLSSKTDFLEVNLQAMKIKLWQKGELKKEVSILAKGDPQGWGGSASGLYKILSGNKLSFSIIANVYMPYALHYYGKYYIHGEPYYPDGEKLSSEVSGGCLRLSDKDAKTIYEMTELNMPVLIIDKEKDNYQWPEAITEFPEVSAQSYLVTDLDSGFVLADKNPEEKFSIASLTKLMTAIVVAENVDLKKSITITQKMLEAYGSTEGLAVGKSFRVVELFYPLLIESSNDAAEVLSYFLGREKTIKLMNEKAKMILMENTNFVDPSGFDLNNVSTAKDLFYLARYIFYNRPPILEITKGKKVESFGEIRFDIEKLWNKNVFINDPTFIGGKTGFLKESGGTAIFLFRFNNQRNIVISLLKSKDVEADTQKIYIWLQKNYFKI